jgi:hypothetical protein
MASDVFEAGSSDRGMVVSTSASDAVSQTHRANGDGRYCWGCLLVIPIVSGGLLYSSGRLPDFMSVSPAPRISMNFWESLVQILRLNLLTTKCLSK